MRYIPIRTAVAILLLCGSGKVFAQTHEIGLTLGGLVAHDKTAGSDNIHFGTGTSLQANYGYRLWSAPGVAVYAEVHMLASPQRLIQSGNQAITKDVASLFLVPGLRVKLLPHSRIAPWAEAGYGFADFQHSLLLLNGKPNPAPRDVQHGVFEWGGGVDVPLWKFVGLRGEIRDFLTTPPDVNLVLKGKLHNAVLGGGFVIRLGH